MKFSSARNLIQQSSIKKLRSPRVDYTVCKSERYTRAPDICVKWNLYDKRLNFSETRLMKEKLEITSE